MKLYKLIQKQHSQSNSVLFEFNQANIKFDPTINYKGKLKFESMVIVDQFFSLLSLFFVENNQK